MNVPLPGMGNAFLYDGERLALFSLTAHTTVVVGPDELRAALTQLLAALDGGPVVDLAQGQPKVNHDQSIATEGIG